MAVCSVVGFLDNVSFSMIHVTNVTVNATFIDGTAIASGDSSSLTSLTMLSTIVNIAMQNASLVSTGKNIAVNVVSSSIDVVHATTIPIGITFMIVLSAASAISVVRSMENAMLSADGTHVRRSFLTKPSVAIGSGGVLPPFGTALNITAVISFFDASSALSTFPSLTFFIQQLLKVTGSPAVCVHTNTTATLTTNCTAECIAAATVPVTVVNASTSFIALFLLPRVANRSTFAVRNTRGGGDPSLGASVIGAIGQTRFVDSAVIAKDVSATAMLLFAAVAPLVLEGSYNIIDV